jgi:putative transposase
MKYLLADDAFKDIIISSLQFLVNDGRVIIYGFVIMPNHIHLVLLCQLKKKVIKLKIWRFAHQSTSLIIDF